MTILLFFMGLTVGYIIGSVCFYPLNLTDSEKLEVDINKSETLASDDEVNIDPEQLHERQLVNPKLNRKSQNKEVVLPEMKSGVSKVCLNCGKLEFDIKSTKM